MSPRKTLRLCLYKERRASRKVSPGSGIFTLARRGCLIFNMSEVNKAHSSHCRKAWAPDKHPGKHSILITDKGGVFSGVTHLLAQHKAVRVKKSNR